LKKAGWESFLSGDRIRLVTTAARGVVYTALPPNVLYLPTFYSLNLPKEYDIRLCFPSVLKSLKIIHNEDPAEIYISTPGPVGLMGLLCAKLLNIKCTGFYHSDLSMEAKRLSEDKAPIELLRNYTRWFYSEMDAVKVGAREYLDILEQQGLDRTKLALFSGFVDGRRERQSRTVGDAEHPEEKSAVL
jgi:hypothetical protein